MVHECRAGYSFVMTKTLTLAATLVAATLIAACGDATTQAGSGTLAVQLTDAPFSGDSVSRVDLFVVRIDARIADADSTAAARSVTDDSVSSSGWTTIATPNASVNLLTYQLGLFLPLGQANVPAGTYRGFRLIIDPTRSSVTLKNSVVLSGTSTPNVSFPSASRTGIKVNLTQTVTITANQTTTVLLDFVVNESFVQRGNTIVQNGLLFKPVIRATVK